MISTPFVNLFLPLSAALGLSIVVERILEILKNIFETIPLRSNTIRIPRTKSKTELDSVAIDAVEYETKAKGLHNREIDERTIILVQDANDPDDGVAFKRCVMMLLGFAGGILLASFTDLKLMITIVPGMEAFKWLDHILTGLLIGAGSAPIHSIISFIVERRSVLDVVATKTAEPAPIVKPGISAVKPISIPSVQLYSAPDPDAWVDIPYDGGVDRDILENVHFRQHDPDCVIYHHTAMHSESTFQDVVNVIKSHKITETTHWLTGYNCVVLADGSIHPFCRWDRAGIHAGDMNPRSLGLAFNGNFETDPAVSGANVGNRLGIDKPSDAQLRSGARVIALWILLYGINYAADFSKYIIAHKKAPGASTVCPGSNFPYAQLETLVRRYRDAWSRTPPMRAIIDDYKLKPYIYMKPRKDAAHG